MLPADRRRGDRRPGRDGHRAARHERCRVATCNWSKSASSTVADLQLHYNSAPISQAFRLGLDKDMLGAKEQRVDVGQGAVLKTGVGDIIVLVGGSTFEVSAKYGAPLPDDVMIALATAAAGRVS